VHKSHFVQDAPDGEWIPVCAANGWIILTGDKGIENDGINRSAVINSAAKIFMLYDHKSRGLEQTAALIAARKKIAQTALNNVGPFYCPIEMVGDSHVGKPRFYPGGYAIQTESIPEPENQQEKIEGGELPKKKRPKQRSEKFEFD
jgi:hypothetical protein